MCLLVRGSEREKNNCGGDNALCWSENNMSAVCVCEVETCRLRDCVRDRGLCPNVLCSGNLFNFCTSVQACVCVCAHVPTCMFPAVAVSSPVHKELWTAA